MKFLFKETHLSDENEQERRKEKRTGGQGSSKWTQAEKDQTRFGKIPFFI